MKKLFLITGYDSFNYKNIRKAFLIQSEALIFSLSLTDSKMQILNGSDYVSIFNDYLKEAIK
jgi:hypothetical protein